MNLRNLSIGMRLGACLAAVLAIAAALLGISLWSSAHTRSAMWATLAVSHQRERATQAMHQAMLRSAIAVRNMGLQTEVDGVNAAESAAKQAQSSYRAYNGQLVAAGVSDEERPLFEGLNRLTTDIDRYFVEAVGLAQQFNTEQAAAIISDKIDPLTTSAVVVLGRLAEQQRRSAMTALDAAEQQASRTVVLLLLTGTGGLLLAAGIGWRLTRSIVAPLREAVAVAQRVAEGDLTTRADATGDDEMAQLLRALNLMNDSLSSVVGQVRQCSDSVATGSAEIASGNSDLSARTEQQAATLQQTAASMDELSSTVSQNAANAQQANQLAQGACDLAVEGGRAVADVVDKMRGISESSHRIRDIIGVIDGIAFQTNILALNAAVEAARAGEQGRGCAVVAGEVRTLARRSADAAREIKALITTSVERVEHGNAQVARAGTTMNDIVVSIRRVNDIIAEISCASHEQSRGVVQIGQAVTQMDQATQQNAALVEQSAAAAECLKQQAVRLVESVAVFRLDANTPTLAAPPSTAEATPYQGPAPWSAGPGAAGVEPLNSVLVERHLKEVGA